MVGYPIGGDTMSVTSGVVSRIEVTSYIHGAAELLGIQIDAAVSRSRGGGGRLLLHFQWARCSCRGRVEGFTRWEGERGPVVWPAAVKYQQVVCQRAGRAAGQSNRCSGERGKQNKGGEGGGRRRVVLALHQEAFLLMKCINVQHSCTEREALLHVKLTCLQHYCQIDPPSAPATHQPANTK